MQISKLLLLLIIALFLVTASACSTGDEVSPAPMSTSAPVTITTPRDTGVSSTPTPVTQHTPELTPTIAPCIIQLPVEGQPNLFHNPGFEEGAAPWCVLSAPMFEVSTEQSHSGQSSAYLHLKQPAQATGIMLNYLVQEVAPAEFPEFISGYYRVDKWDKGTPDQYLQFVIIVFEAANRPSASVSNHQIRYPLAGISEDPFKISISNAFFVFIGTEEPRIGEWVYFERNIKQDFQQLWGAVPEGFANIRVLFEVRYDNKETGAPTEAEVYYDDLYLGPASENPNHPL